MISTAKPVKIPMLLDYNSVNAEKKKSGKMEKMETGDSQKIKKLMSSVLMWNAQMKKFAKEETVLPNEKKGANHGKQKLMENVLMNVSMWNVQKVKYVFKENVLLMNVQTWNAQKERNAYWEHAEK